MPFEDDTAVTRIGLNVTIKSWRKSMIHIGQDWFS